MIEMRFILKTLFIYCLTIVLIDGNTPFIGKFVAQSVFAEEPATNENLQMLSDAYNGLFRTPRSDGKGVDLNKVQENLLSARGADALKKGNDFVKDPANRALLGTPSGMAFLKMHNKFSRLKKVQGTMANCFNAASGKSQFNKMEYHGGLPERIFAAAYSTPEGEIDCDPALFNTDSIDGLFGGVSPVVNAADNKDRIDGLNKLQVEIQNKNLVAAARTLANMKITYAGTDTAALKANPPITDAVANGIVNRLCQKTTGASNRQRTTRYCSAAQRAELKKAVLEEQTKTLAQPGLKTYSYGSAATDLKERILRINNVITESPFTKTDNTIWPDNIDPTTDQSKQSYQRYIGSFMTEAETGPGLLFWTDAIGDDMGMRRDQDTRFMGIWGGGFDTRTNRLKHHSDTHINEAQVRAAVREAENKTIERAMETHQLEKERKDDMADYEPGSWGWMAHNSETLVNARKSDLKKLISENPTSIGQALMDNPEMTDEACLMVQEIATDAEYEGSWRNWKKWMWAGLIVGGALLGVGALAGLAMLAFAGTAATGAAILSALTVPGLIYGAVETGYAVNKYRNAAAEREALRASLITGTADRQTANEFYRAMEEAQDAAIEAGLALGFTVLDAAAFLRIARQMGSAAEATRYFKRLARGANVMKSSEMRAIFRHVRPLVGKAKVQRMLDEMLKLEDGVEFLRKVKNLSLDEAADFFRNGYVVCNRFCG